VPVFGNDDYTSVIEVDTKSKLEVITPILTTSLIFPLPYAVKHTVGN